MLKGGKRKSVNNQWIKTGASLCRGIRADFAFGELSERSYNSESFGVAVCRTFGIRACTTGQAIWPCHLLVRRAFRLPTRLSAIGNGQNFGPTSDCPRGKFEMSVPAGTVGSCGAIATVYLRTRRECGLILLRAPCVVRYDWWDASRLRYTRPDSQTGF